MAPKPAVLSPPLTEASPCRSCVPISSEGWGPVGTCQLSTSSCRPSLPEGDSLLLGTVSTKNSGRRPQSFWMFTFTSSSTLATDYLLSNAPRSQWSIGHQRPPAIALCSGLLLSFRISWSPAVSALLQCLASNCCEAGLSSSSLAGSRSGLGVWCWMLAS